MTAAGGTGTNTGPTTPDANPFVKNARPGSPAPTAPRPTTPAPITPAPRLTAARHTLVEDILGFCTGTVMASFGLYLLHASATVTGGTAGLSLLLSYALPVPFGVLFLLVNLPFLVAAVSRKGWTFTLRTLLAIGAVTVLTSLHAAMLPHLVLPAVYSVVLGNMIAGVGLLVLFRHRASLGGFNIVGLLLQERRGIPAGYVQMVLDLMVVLGSLAVLPWPSVAFSALGAVILNLVIAFNHRPDRYVGW
ncbi:MAG TPA: YitT family protein [Micropruina sp.]|nr:YitT family protein [Micropruina sp.]